MAILQPLILKQVFIKERFALLLKKKSFSSLELFLVVGSSVQNKQEILERLCLVGASSSPPPPLGHCLQLLLRVAFGLGHPVLAAVALSCLPAFYPLAKSFLHCHFTAHQGCKSVTTYIMSGRVMRTIQAEIIGTPPIILDF